MSYTALIAFFVVPVMVMQLCIPFVYQDEIMIGKTILSSSKKVTTSLHTCKEIVMGRFLYKECK